MTNGLRKLICSVDADMNDEYGGGKGPSLFREANLCAVVKPLVWGQHPDDQEWYAKLPEIEGDTFERGYMVLPNKSHFTLYDGFASRARVIGHFTLATEAKAAAQADYEARILSAITIRSASDVAAEARAGAIEAAARNIEAAISNGVFVGKLPDHIRALHDTDTLAAIERIKEQARQEERERVPDMEVALLAADKVVEALRVLIDREAGEYDRQLALLDSGKALTGWDAIINQRLSNHIG